LSLGLGACAHHKSLPPGEALSISARQEDIRRAAVWFPTDIPSMDLKAGPDGPGALPPDAWVDCKYKQKEMSGESLKFTCVDASGDELKVKYGATNAEVYGEVLATRLFWALGFPADRMYPVRVRCDGCPNDPKHQPAPGTGVVTFDPAAVERKLAGRPLEIHQDSGWKWSELEDIGPGAPENARSQRDALKLLAAFVQHTDNKAANQRLLCPAGSEIEKSGCRQPVMLVQDLGLTFGRATLMNKNKNSVSIDNWLDIPVWKDSEGCIARLKGSFTGSLSDPRISEGGRKFLAGLMVQLSDAQLHDLFETGRVERRSSDPSSQPEGDAAPPSIDAWVDAFKAKRQQIVDRTCPL
jgi:hypothetical protein